MCNTEVTQKDLYELLNIFARKAFDAGQCENSRMNNEILKKCEFLFQTDYKLIELDNSNGVLCTRYPSRILIPEYEHSHMAATITVSNATALNNSDSGGGGGAAAAAAVDRTVNLRALSVSSSESCGSGTGIHAFVTFANPLQQQQQEQQEQPAQPPVFQAQAQPIIYEDTSDIGKIRELINMAKYARCRQRFAVPVIMYRGKYICRSATIAIFSETYGRRVVNFAYDCLNGVSSAERANAMDEENNDPTEESLINESAPFSYEEAIKHDIRLLNALNVSTIVDLMVEMRKHKYFMPVSSSEKADSENHYENFNVLSLPYPGCEFFTSFRDNNYVARSLKYNWSQSFNDAILSIPRLGPASDLDISWSDYKKWDLVQITQNYLKATLKYLQEDNSGLLIHCISGWDRTPLFISLIRLSLWADGLIHQSLNALQMAYFTLAYDWYLFGHQLPDRLKNSEDIMFFCFHVLKYITDDEFSIAENRKRTKTSSSSGSSSSVIVIRSDYIDDFKEDFILNFDQDSNDSFSNISNCDISITDNFFASTYPIMPTAPTIYTTMASNAFISRSPNPKRSKTSPISVPGASATRQRQDSTSSNSSWQVVTVTGSIDSQMNGSYLAPGRLQQPEGAASNSNSPLPNVTDEFSDTCDGSNSNNSSDSFVDAQAATDATATDETDTASNAAANHSPLTLRKQRLNAVRAIIIQAYGKTIGLKFKEGSSMNLATVVGTLF